MNTEGTMLFSVKARHLPPRVAAGAFILNSGIGRITSDVSRDTDSVLKAPPASTVPDTGRAGTDG